MGKADKLLFVVVTTLIFLSIVWFAHFSQTQMNLTFAGATSQILDAAKADCVGLMNTRPKHITLYGVCLRYRQSRKS